MQIGRGCPQGSCFGPLFWLLLVNDILRDFDREDCSLVAYADDFVLIVSENSRLKLENKVNLLLDKFHNTAKDHKLNISIDKTLGIVFGKSLDKRKPIFKINNNSIKIVKILKYLGVYIDFYLNFIPHIRHIKEDIVQLSMGVNRVCGPTWGVPPEMIRTWYVTVIQSRLTYGIPAWFPSLNVHGKRALESCQRSFLLKIFPVYKNISTSALNVIVGVAPINLIAETLVDKYNFMRGNSSVFYNNEFLSFHDFEGVNYKYTINSIGYPTNLFINDYSYKSNMFNVSIYTDGSKSDDGVGYAFIIFNVTKCICKKMFRLRLCNSIFQAEALAIYEALYWLFNNNFNSAILFTDSKSVTEALKNITPKSKIISNIQNLIASNSNATICINWIRAHVGTPGNEIADTLAKYSINNGKLSIIYYPFSLLKQFYKNKLLENWQLNWDTTLKGRYTYEIFKLVSHDLRISNKILIYFVSGRGSFPTFLHSIGKKDDNLCPCGQEGSPHHYLQVSCSFSKIYVKRKTDESLYDYFRRIDNSMYHINKVKKIYNDLNRQFSFITYTF